MTEVMTKTKRSFKGTFKGWAVFGPDNKPPKKTPYTVIVFPSEKIANAYKETLLDKKYYQVSEVSESKGYTVAPVTITKTEE